MQTLETVKTKGQESINNLLEKGKEQPDEVKTWGVTAGAAIVGGLAVAAVARGVLAILGTLASPPVALTVGAIGGGVLGWNYIRNQAQAGQGDEAAASTLVSEEAVDIPVTTAESVAADTTDETMTADSTTTEEIPQTPPPLSESDGTTQ